MSEPLVKIENLRKYFPVRSDSFLPTQKIWVKAVDGVDLEIQPDGWKSCI
jgi:ABC-type oligopeptide transport system ATPase subunit